MGDDTDSLPLDGDKELTSAERLMLRKMMRDEERASWARRRLKILIPALVAVVAAVWQAADWAIRHIQVRP